MVVSDLQRIGITWNTLEMQIYGPQPRPAEPNISGGRRQPGLTASGCLRYPKWTKNELKSTSCIWHPFSVSPLSFPSFLKPVQNSPSPGSLPCLSSPAGVLLVSPLSAQRDHRHLLCYLPLHWSCSWGTPASGPDSTACGLKAPHPRSLSSLCHQPPCSLGWHIPPLGTSFPLEGFPSSGVLSSPLYGLWEEDAQSNG